MLGAVYNIKNNHQNIKYQNQLKPLKLLKKPSRTARFSQRWGGARAVNEIFQSAAGITGPTRWIFLPASTVGLAEQLRLTGRTELVQLPQGPDVIRQSVPPGRGQGRKGPGPGRGQFNIFGAGDPEQILLR